MFLPLQLDVQCQFALSHLTYLGPLGGGQGIPPEGVPFTVGANTPSNPETIRSRFAYAKVSPHPFRGRLSRGFIKRIHLEFL